MFKLNKNCFVIVVVMVLLGHCGVNASAASSCQGTPHTRHVITVNKNAICVLSKLYETQQFCLVNAVGDDIAESSFAVAPGQGKSFGMIFKDGTDFNMEYALTCVEADGGYAKSPKTIFTIGANGPASPSISIINLYGARGTWQDAGDGENFSIVF